MLDTFAVVLSEDISIVFIYLFLLKKIFHTINLIMVLPSPISDRSLVCLPTHFPLSLQQA